MPQAFPPLGAEYEPFLYAILYEEADGAPLSVVSAIARSGVDPWREAARITTLPRPAAFEALARLAPGRDEAETNAIVRRLLALLPVKRRDAPAPAAVQLKKAAGGTLSPSMLIAAALLLGLTLAYVFRTPGESPVAPPDRPAAASQTDKADP